MSFARAASLLLLAMMTAGCLPVIVVKTRTRILPDGTTLRETRFEKERRHADNEQERFWNERPISDDLGRGLGRGFVTRERTDDVLVFSGVFTDPAAMPPDFLRDVAVLKRASRNHVDYRTEDLLFGTRHLYRERFVDAVAPENQKQARRELVDFAIHFLKAAVRHEFDHRYDPAGFDSFAHEQLEPLFDQLIEIYWNERRLMTKADPHTGLTGFDRALARALKLLEPLGLLLDRELEEEENLARFRAWFQELLANTLEPLHPSSSRPRPGDFDYLFPEEEPLSGLTLALERAAEREYGGVQEARDAFEILLLGVTGTYGSPPAEAEFRFDCAVELPGLLLRSNGFLESDRSAFWLFEGPEIFPDGFLLEAESVVIDTRRLGRIRELKSALDRRDMVLLIQRLEGVDAKQRQVLAKVLDECARQGTLEAHAQMELDEPTARQFDRVIEVVLKQR